ncbi:Glutamate receptor 2.7 [Linum perenne]
MNYQLFIIKIAAVFLFICGGAGGATTAGGGRNGSTVRIGAMVDVGSRVGREEKTAIEIALKNFNEKSTRHNFSAYYANYTQSDPLKAAYSEAIIGLQSWDESALVGEIGSRFRVPVLSLAPSTISRPLKQLRWPSLMNIAGNNGATDEIQCIAALVRLYEWRKVIVIYEDDAYGGNSGKLDLLSESLTKIGSEIEHRLILPPYSSLLSSGSKKLVRDDVISLFRQQSRVFIVLQASLPMAIELFKEAKSVGLSGRDSAWIVADDLASLLDSVDETVISSMEGTLGIKRYFSDQGSPYRSFKSEFRNRFRSEFPEEDNLVPGIHALRAYDGIRAIADAVEREEGNKTLTEKLLSSNFTGLSGELCFSSCRNPKLRVVNVVGKKYRELDFWRPELGIFTNTAVANASEIGDKIGGKLSGTVIWPGGSDQVPKGWAMPTDAKPMKIVIPKRTSFEKFVSWPDGKKSPEGFCIALFDKILRLIDYALPHEFICYDESYDDLIQGVYNQTFDAAVGDLTILAERYQYVDFTQPFTESGLSTIVRSSPDDSPWMFTKPFDFQMWTMCLALLLYTIVVVWFMEHNSNPEFQGPWNAQLGTALWFIFCSLFFVQKEKINNNITRVAVVVWFSVVFILTQSYTASLTSMLTVKRMGPDFEILKQNKVHVGCDNDSFVKGYLENVLDFQKDRILIFDNESEYITAFETNRIGAAFLEIPYEKIFINKHCGEYTTTRASNRFGGFGFAFQKGSPIRRDFSEAILKLSENGTLKRMEEEWFGSEPECPKNDRLTLRSFMGLFIISGGTSTLCLIVYLARGRFRGRGSRVQAASDEEETVILAGETAGDVDGMGKPHGPIRAVTFPSVHSIPQWRSWSSKWQSVRCSEPVEDDDASTVTIEMPKFENVKNQRV